MTAASRRGDSLAPSLFPFLAVLLCTMGALVLILVLLVAGAESSGKEVVKQLDEQLQWEHEKLQLVKSGLHEKYEEAKIELEKKRLVLQNYEQHIHELNEELKQLEKVALQTEEKVDTEKDSKQTRDELRESLEKQLAEAKEQLEKKLKDPKGDKPIFAIIPYAGPNGTHRRPIYLECNAKGVVVQPEGVLLNPVDLRPPYGPGNPLDAVLRTIRAEFPATNGAVTSNPYPLLVVRPSGIRHFMMARAAMSGWDDQFGYELISEELELTYPPSVPKLEQKIVSAIDLARERQAALVMAMPQHYSASQLDSFGAYGGGSGSAGGFADDSLDFGDGSGNAGSENSVASASGTANGTGAGSGRRGGFSMGAGQSVGGAEQGKNNFAAEGTSGSGAKPNGQQGANGQLTMAQAAMPLASQAGLRQGLQPQSGGPSDGSGQMSFFGSGGTPEDPLALGGSSSRKQFGQNSGSGGDISFDGSSGAFAGDAGGGSAGSTSAGGSADGSSTDSSNSANGGSSGGSSNGSAGGGSAAGGGSSGGSANGQPGPAGMRGSASAGGSSASAASSGQIGGATPTDSSSVSADANADPSQAGGISSLNMNFSKNQGEAAKPIAQSRGRDWAWRDGNRSQTAVIRAIRIQCYVDRWVMLPDRSSKAAPTVINLDGAIVQRAEKLAEAVTGRVNNWGVAVAGGHWAPVLHVDVASDAEWRFQQLQRLMEGSGIDVIRKSTIAPQSR